MTKLKNLNCEKLNNSNYDKTVKLNFLQNSKTQIVTKLKISICDQTQKLKSGQKFNKSNCDKTQIVTKF